MSWGAKVQNTCKHVFHHSPSRTWDTRLGMFNLGSHCLCSALSARQQHYIHSLHPYRALQPTCVCGEGGGGGGGADCGSKYRYVCARARDTYIPMKWIVGDGCATCVTFLVFTHLAA